MAREISYKLPRSKLQGIPSGKFVLRHDTPQQNCGVFRSQNKSKGFLSILELLFALFIFLVGFLMILGIYPTSFMSVSKSRELIFATNIAQREMERLKAIPYNNFPYAQAGTSIDLYSGIDSMQFLINGQTTQADFDWTDKVSTYMQDDPNFNYKGLQVTVGWQSSTGYQVYTLETLIVDQN